MAEQQTHFLKIVTPRFYIMVAESSKRKLVLDEDLKGQNIIVEEEFLSKVAKLLSYFKLNQSVNTVIWNLHSNFNTTTLSNELTLKSNR